MEEILTGEDLKLERRRRIVPMASFILSQPRYITTTADKEGHGCIGMGKELFLFLKCGEHRDFLMRKY